MVRPRGEYYRTALAGMTGQKALTLALAFALALTFADAIDPHHDFNLTVPAILTDYCVSPSWDEVAKNILIPQNITEGLFASSAFAFSVGIYLTCPYIFSGKISIICTGDCCSPCLPVRAFVLFFFFIFLLFFYFCFHLF